MQPAEKGKEKDDQISYQKEHIKNLENGLKNSNLDKKTRERGESMLEKAMRKLRELLGVDV